MSKKPFRIIAAMDRSAHGEAALRMALDLAHGREGAEVHIAHAITAPSIERRGAKIEAQSQALESRPAEIWTAAVRILEELGIPHDEVELWQHTRLGEPVEVIRQVARDYEADLVVTGSRRRSAARRFFMGTVADTLVHDGRFPVLVAHPNMVAAMEKTETLPEPARPGQELSDGTRPMSVVSYSASLSGWHPVTGS